MNYPKHYRKKPVVIQAMEFTGDNAQEVTNWISNNGYNCSIEIADLGISLTIETLEGDHIASAEDFIIRGVRGEFYPCKPDIFWKTYQEADETI